MMIYKFSWTFGHLVGSALIELIDPLVWEKFLHKEYEKNMFLSMSKADCSSIKH